MLIKLVVSFALTSFLPFPPPISILVMHMRCTGVMNAELILPVGANPLVSVEVDVKTRGGFLLTDRRRKNLLHI
jgi:hypothetical protein